MVYTQQSLFGMVQNVRPCPDCQGTGKIIKDKCPDCYGTGYIASKKKISVSVPAGIDNGQSIRIRGKGEPGVNGGPRGDLLVEVQVSRHPIFQRQDIDIFSTVPISFPVATRWNDPDQDCGRRSRVRCESRNPDRYQSTAQRKRYAVSQKQGRAR